VFTALPSYSEANPSSGYISTKPRASRNCQMPIAVVCVASFTVRVTGNISGRPCFAQPQLTPQKAENICTKFRNIFIADRSVSLRATDDPCQFMLRRLS
jgi:hypothetical protein